MKLCAMGALTVFASVWAANAAEPEHLGFSTTKDIRSATIHLQIRGLKAFLGEALTQGVEAPGIRSKYWIDQFAKGEPDVAAKENALRDFGYEVALQLDRMAVDIHKCADDPQNVAKLEWLLGFKDWIVKPGRYENLRLAARAENAATMPLLRAIVDLRVPDAEIDMFFGRFTDGTESAKLRANVLFDESAGLFDFRGNLELLARQEDFISKWWTPRSRASGERYGRRALRYKYDFELLNKDKVKYNFFYTDDDRVHPRTLSNNWNNKEHKWLCAFRIKADGLDSLRRVHEFRKAARRFPVVSVPAGTWPRHAYEDFYDAAFQKEKSAGLSPRLAAAFFLQCKTNSFMDQETAETVEDMQCRGDSQYTPHGNCGMEMILEKRKRENEKWMADNGPLK